ncbi:monovalent cation/H+ antiporter subunit D [Marinospirillum sp. MEB164]|uniref:Monovalent cation/H+ antiporter subunit D n=1 Tax=Marinospirillum alkalitolerans TaxID=3123374 RepID=A0ABW8PZN4_9GAMM
MMVHLMLAPVVLPFLTGSLLLLPFARSNTRRRNLVLVSSVLLLAVSLVLLVTTHQQGASYYALGGWAPPYGILFYLDRLASLMLVLTSLLTLAVLLYACAGEDKTGSYFYPLVMFQVAGIQGAFLTADIFNLFVFFEILLMASYALLMHGGGRERARVGVHYVILNLVGSSLFLLALGLLYATLGSLSLPDLAVRVQQVSEDQQPLVKAAGLLLLAVFALKAALLPLHFWLAATYSAASAPVAALFAIMTKVGLYSIYRVHTQLFGPAAGDLAGLVQPWLWPLAGLTLVAAIVGLLASQQLRRLVAYSILLSVGTLVFAAALQTPEALGAALYYLVHSTLISAALFLLADVILQQRGQDALQAGPAVRQPVWLGGLFFVAALVAIGLPPFSGFMGKLLLLQASVSHGLWIWPWILLGSLALIITFSRAGSSLFWRAEASLQSASETQAPRMHWTQLAAILLLLACSPLMVIFAEPLYEFTFLAAEALFVAPQPLIWSET